MFAGGVSAGDADEVCDADGSDCGDGGGVCAECGAVAGVLPVRVGGITIPQVAWTWYVLIGAAVTFAVGSVASLVFGKQSARRGVVAVIGGCCA